MRIGTTVGLQLDGPQTIEDIVAEVGRTAELGLAGAWWAQVFGWDALTAITVAGLAVPDLALGTAVVPTYPRHPVALAGQALSVQAAVGNRLTLGIGPSHKPIIEGALGLEFDRPALHTREYLTALVPLLHGEAVDVRGEIYRVAGQVAVAGAQAPSVLVAALGPLMLQVAGELADGTVATWTGVRTIAGHIAPRITEAAEAAGRPAPRIVVCLPVAVTGDADAARAWVAERFGAANDLPSYRAMVDIEGAAGVDELVIAGDEAAVERQLARLHDAGTTELIAVPFGPADQVDRTLRLLGDLAGDPRTPDGLAVA
jgi:F420-dependent oxidoreductase-like protein